MKRPCPYSSNPQLVGDPVDTLTGACVERQRDFRLAGPLPLQWWRHYDSSRVDQKFSLGWGHAHDFDCCLRFDQDGIRFEAPLGQATFFPPLVQDGQTVRWQGKTLTRISLNRYILWESSSPAREFIFSDPELPARLTAIFQTTGRIAFQYDDNQRLSVIIDSLGTTIEVAVGNDGLVHELFIDKLGGRPRRDLITYQYDARGNLVAGIDGFGSRFTLHYDRRDRLVRKTDRVGYSFEFTYDADGRCIRTTGSDGVLDHRLEYVEPGSLTRVTRADGGIWEYAYQFDKLVSITDPLGGQQRFVYDDQGKLITELDPNGNQSQIQFDAAGAAVGKRDALGHFHAIPEDYNVGSPREHHVPENAAEYEFGRLVSLAQIDVSLAASTSNHHTTIQPASQAFERSNLASSTNLGFVVGRSWWPRPASGRKFDASGDLIHQVDREGRLRRWMYDGNGNVTKHVDFDGGTWTYEYRSWNQLVAERNPLGLVLRRGYDAQDNLACFEDAGGTKSEFRYDQKNQLIEVRRNGRVRERYQRDAAGNLLTKFAADGRQLLQMEYGIGNLLVKRGLASGEEHAYRYDKQGRYLAANTSKDAIEFAYDVSGNRILEKRNGVGVEHRYRGWRKFGESRWIEKFICRQEVEGRSTLRITDPTGGTHRIRILPGGKVERHFGNGTGETIQYDASGRCMSKSVTRWSAAPWKRVYHWSGEGELRQVEDSRFGTTTYTYDAAHRLSQRITPDRQSSQYEFDSTNNLIAQPGLSEVVLQGGNRIRTASGEAFETNDRDHLRERTSIGGEKTTYFYDSRDQLVRAELPSGVWQAEYDALGRRVRKTFNGATTEYLWNTDQLAGEIFPDGRLRLYVYADPLALTPLLFVEYESIDADPESGDCFIVLADQIGTPVCIEDSTGAVVWQARIEPFGEARLSPGNSIEFHLRFPGHYWDDDIRLNYNRFRMYDPHLGRYLQSDPLGIAGGANVYAYPANPLAYVDTHGLNCPSCPIGYNPNCEDCVDGEQTHVGPRPKPPDPPLLDQIGQPSGVLTNRSSERPYRQPPEIYLVGPNRPLNVSAMDPSKRYLWVVDPHGNIWVAPERQPGFGRVVKHGDLTPAPDGMSRGPARAGGELNYNRNTGVWEMNNESSYTFARTDGTHSDGASLNAAHEHLTNSGTDTSNIDAVNSHGADAGPPQHQ